MGSAWFNLQHCKRGKQRETDTGEINFNKVFYLTQDTQISVILICHQYKIYYWHILHSFIHTKSLKSVVYFQFRHVHFKCPIDGSWLPYWIGQSRWLRNPNSWNPVWRACLSQHSKDWCGWISWAQAFESPHLRQGPQKTIKEKKPKSPSSILLEEELRCTFYSIALVSYSQRDFGPRNRKLQI